VRPFPLPLSVACLHPESLVPLLDCSRHVFPCCAATAVYLTMRSCIRQASFTWIPAGIAQNSLVVARISQRFTPSARENLAVGWSLASSGARYCFFALGMGMVALCMGRALHVLGVTAHRLHAVLAVYRIPGGLGAHDDCSGGAGEDRGGPPC
jgi:hypothetical protein